LLGEGLSPSRIRNILMPLRVIYRRAVEDGIVAMNPTTNLRLPAVRGTRDRIASPEEAARLLAVLWADKALWRRRSTADCVAVSYGVCSGSTSTSPTG
jgi:hypothetical protein